MKEVFKKDGIEIEMYLNSDGTVNPNRMMRVIIFENGELTEYDCYPDRNNNSNICLVQDQFQYVKSSLKFDLAYSKRYLELVKVFLLERPNISASALSKESGFDERYLRLILEGKRNPTVNFVEKLNPILLKYGFGR